VLALARPVPPCPAPPRPHQAPAAGSRRRLGVGGHGL